MSRTFAPIVPPTDPRECAPWLNRELRRISMKLQQSERGFAAVARGEAPDASGSPLVDLSGVFLLAGRVGNQLGAGGTQASGSLTLTSTSHPTKGFIYLGSSTPRIAFDETNCFTGFGTDAPTARIHAHLPSTGTSGVNQLGTHFGEYSVNISGTLKNILALAAYANNASSFDVAFVSGGTNPINGIGSIYFSDLNATSSTGTGMRLAYGAYGSDLTAFTHLQFGGLDGAGVTKNRNCLLVGFNDNCGSHFETHFNTMWFESEGTFSDTVTRIGINGDNPEDRASSTGAGSQPILNIAAAPTPGQQYETALEVHTGRSWPSTDDASAKVEVMKLRADSNANSGSRIFAVDRWGRLCFYNPGNGALSSRLGSRRSLLLLEDSTTPSTPLVYLECVSTNAFADGGASGCFQLRLGYDDTTAITKWLLIGGSLSAGGNVQPALLARAAFRTSAFYVSDGSYDPSGDVGAPLGLVNIFNHVAIATRLLTLARKSGQTGDFMSNYSSDKSTVLSGIDFDGHWYEKISGNTGFAATDKNVTVDNDGNVITHDGELVLLR